MCAASAGDHSQRAVLLGASNITQRLSTVVRTACAAAGGPLDLLIAAGHGRSYGNWSYVLGRGLPGILQSRLWSALETATHRPAMSLLTDIGNDLLFGRSVDVTAQWVDQCLTRLRPLSDTMVMTQLPMASLRRLGRARFLVARALLFPSTRLTLKVALQRAEQLNEQLLRLAEQHDVQLIEPRSQWYGLDPIHIRMRHATAAWQEIFQPWSKNVKKQSPVVPWHAGWSLRTAVPDERTLWGMRQLGHQPARRWRDGTTLSFY